MYTTPTPRRSIKRSPTSSPSSPALDSQHGDESPTAKLGRGPGYSSLLPSPDASLKTPGFGPDRGQMGVGRGAEVRSVQMRDSLAGPDLSPSRGVLPGSQNNDHGEEKEEEAVDGLISDMQRNMRIVSSSSARPRMSEVEVDGLLGGVEEEEEEHDVWVGGRQRGPEQSKDGRETPGSRVMVPRSLRQPAIQPRMNKSTLARLNPSNTPSNSSLGAGRPGTPGKEIFTPARRPLSMAAARAGDSPSGGERNPMANNGTETPEKKVLPNKETPGGGKRRSLVLTPASLKPPAITPRGTRSSDLRRTMIDNPLYLSPVIDKLSVSRLSGLTAEEVKKRETAIFQGTPGHRRGLSLKEKEGLWSLRPSTPHRTNRSADLRRDPTLANRPATPTREFKARPLPAMYGAGGGARISGTARVEGGAVSPRGERQGAVASQESRPKVRG